MRVTALADTSGAPNHGECVVTEWADGRRVVVDLGDGTEGLGAEGLWRPTGVLVLTHDDEDHIGPGRRSGRHRRAGRRPVALR
jgi:glyoxylase-like metal-dependent hydrolase (beta-lactamase superfamily II)